MSTSARFAAKRTMASSRSARTALGCAVSYENGTRRKKDSRQVDMGTLGSRKRFSQRWPGNPGQRRRAPYRQGLPRFRLQVVALRCHARRWASAPSAPDHLRLWEPPLSWPGAPLQPRLSLQQCRHAPSGQPQVQRGCAAPRRHQGHRCYHLRPREQAARLSAAFAAPPHALSTALVQACRSRLCSRRRRSRPPRVCRRTGRRYGPMSRRSIIIGTGRRITRRGRHQTRHPSFWAAPWRLGRASEIAPLLPSIRGKRQFPRRGTLPTHSSRLTPRARPVVSSFACNIGGLKWASIIACALSRATGW
mmetsp:Transcript_31153/g.85354  ORF Transcript_31153/g.85354 Transcript_31153/m.85354 type:complete len:306 (-) Transcript_31153:462-1379(-)